MNTHNETSALPSQTYGVVYTPTKRRKRFPENCVTTVNNAVEAIKEASASQDSHPAILMGPSRSSEGFRLYYLIRWLD